MVARQDIKKFQKEILAWYAKNKRDLPWRKTRDPYKILVSEVMLQQTQVGRVVPKYEAWLTAFPAIEHLAQAKTRDVLRLWSGLGYNRRALYLQKAAQMIVSEYSGKWPEEVSELQKLPGVGKYTAGAVACFAFNEQTAVVDTNIRKVILHHFFPKESREKVSDKTIHTIAKTLLPRGKSYEWNQALMDYSAAMLKKEKIPIAKQTKFIGSTRYYRGQILKLLLEKERIPVSRLGKLLKTDEKGLTWLEDLLRAMEKDGLIAVLNNRVTIR